MSTAAAIAANRIRAGYPAGPVFIGRGVAVWPDFRACLVSILSHGAGSGGAAGGAAASPAPDTRNQALSAAQLGHVAAICRSGGPASADCCGFRPSRPLINNQRRTALIGAPAGRARRLQRGRGGTPLFDHAPAPHAGRARVARDFADPTRRIRPMTGCTNCADRFGGAETGNFGLGSGVRGRTDTRNLARKTRGNRPLGRKQAVGIRVSVHRPFDPVATAIAAREAR